MTRSLALVLAALALAAAPRPARAQATYTLEHDHATTADGNTLAIRRLHVAGGAPVLMLHGFGTNLNEWDLPSQSFARYLAQQGFDVWMGNWRRIGQAPERSTGRAGYTFDDVMGYDVPALVDHVARTTGQRPFLVGHSMGAMIAYAYLEGAQLTQQVVGQRLVWTGLWFGLQQVSALRVSADPQLAAARNAGIRGLIAIAGPPRMKWSDQATFYDFWQHDYWDYNVILEDLSWNAAAIAVTYATPEIPVGMLTDFLTHDLVTLPYVGPQMQPYLQAVEAQIGQSFLASDVEYGPNMGAQVIQDGLSLAADAESTGILRQFTDAIRNESFREAHTVDAARSPYVYADHYDRITAPLLAIAGVYDKLCDDETMHDDLYLAAGAADKTFLAVAAGHIDLVVGIAAPHDVWAPAAAWLQQH
jgi:alpha-beta hydrolase superfamily lysophospholipase